MCISLFVSLSVYPYYLFFNGGTCIKFLLHTKITHELERKVHYICLIYIFLMEKYRRVLPYTKIADNLRVYYDFGPRPFWKVQGYLKKKFIVCVRFLSFIWKKPITSSFFTLRLLMIRNRPKVMCANLRSLSKTH